MSIWDGIKSFGGFLKEQMNERQARILEYKQRYEDEPDDQGSFVCITLHQPSRRNSALVWFLRNAATTNPILKDKGDSKCLLIKTGVSSICANTAVPK